MDVVVMQGGNVPGAVVVIRDYQRSGPVGFFHAAGAADENEPVNAEDFAGGKMRFVVDVVRRRCVLMAGDEEEGSCVYVGFSKRCGYGFLLERREFCCEESGSAYDA